MEERFKRIYFTNKDRLYHFIKKFTKDSVFVEDLVQECFIKIWDNLSNIKDDELIFPLLRTYAQHIVINHNRKEARKLLRDSAYSEKQPLTVSPDNDLAVKAIWRSFQETIDQFPDKRRQIFLLKKQYGYTHLEIAQKLNLSVKSIEKHMSEANRILRDKFAADKLSVILILVALQQ